MKTSHSQTRSRGFTLVEVMIAVTVSLFLLAGVVQVFISTKQSYRTQQAMSSVQESGRFAMHFLMKELRMAGFTGCQGAGGGQQVYNNVITNIAGTDVTAILAQAGTGIEAINDVATLTTSSGTNLSSIGLTIGTATGNVIAGTDLLVLRRTTSCAGGQLTGNTTVTNANIQVVNPTACGMVQNDIVMISDCISADIFSVTNNPGGAGGTVAHAANNNINPFLCGEDPSGTGCGATGALSKTYGTDAFVRKFNADVYYIGVGASGASARSLYRMDLSNVNFVQQELVEGVRNMQIQFGENVGAADTATIRYVTANNVTNFTDVLSVRVSILTQSEDNITEKVQGVLSYGGTSFTPADRRLYKTFSSVVGVRNRI